MIDLAVSFWVQVLVGLLLLCFFPLTLGRSLQKKYPGCFAHGVSLLLAAGASFVFTYMLLSITSSGGRGWGGLIFIFVLGAQALVAGIGALLLFIGIIMILTRKTDEKA